MSDKGNIEHNNQATPGGGQEVEAPIPANNLSPSGYVMSDAEKKQRNRRNTAIALMVIGFVVLIYFVTILRLGNSVLERSI